MFYALDRVQKKTHWKEFLDDPTNVWKANQYTKLANSSLSIPTLHRGEIEADSDQDKANMLMEAFFPVPPEPLGGEKLDPRWSKSRGKGIPDKLPPITEEE
ncbi:hypothetical protein B0A49_13850, partial [Cryomyces minteri]